MSLFCCCSYKKIKKKVFLLLLFIDENLFRKSLTYERIKKNLYPILNNGEIYIEKILEFVYYLDFCVLNQENINYGVSNYIFMNADIFSDIIKSNFVVIYGVLLERIGGGAHKVLIDCGNFNFKLLKIESFKKQNKNWFEITI